ncbi:MAG TPA: hypothetical protein ENK44_05925 [Caldithrix abyssi]|uniref:Cytochrome b561 bacterial/Ni-hydrogenase domain-containing protein n=1 Tax=Caldithrix abyssi TaxID=187145 RepID=A0A7V4TZH1_CALAY|nr:hypothetical protein [Caldithrix abyssi]
MKKSLIWLFLLLVTPMLSFTQTNDDCMDCHNERDLTKSINDSVEVSVFVDHKVLDNSIHGDLECTDCHEMIEDHPNEEVVASVSCGNCHEDEQADYQKSVHWLSRMDTVVETATCKNCHGTHDILPSDDKNSHTYKLNIEKTCGNCHDKPAVMRRLGLRGETPVSKYHGSVHDRILHEEPDKNPPTCINCHDYHQILSKINPECSYSKQNIPKTCGTCHEKIFEEYQQSVHWQGIQRGHVEAPACNDCHGEHRILSPKSKDAVTNRLNASSQICNNCHASEVMMQRYGLDPRRFESYARSYHGLALLKGDQDAATCTSCHEVHSIRSNLDPLASTNKAHLKETCGQCHDNITESFINIEVHPLDLKSRNPVAYIFRVVYTWLIIVVIGGMLVHNMLILLHFIREKRKREKNMPRVQRFQSWEVYQHFLMFLSFTTLAVTGFALKFPNAGWVTLLVDLGMNEAIRSTLHRAAAIVMGTISVIQLFYFIFTKKGHRDVKALMPTIDDIKDLIQNIKFHLGLTSERPKFPRFDYAEKAEYLALIWGVVVMGASGLVLWFPEIFIGIFPSWLFETSEIIHYYEAWLATLAILVWHWFFVIFHPEKYPVSLTWMDGKITEEELKHHHPLEYEELKSQIKINKKSHQD